jgi:DNA-directed RNA polymerase subunit RPC12/RpoP
MGGACVGYSAEIGDLMAIVACSECGKEVAESAQTCPHCGIKRNRFAKLVPGLVTAGGIILVLAYCSGGGGTVRNRAATDDPCPPGKFLVVNHRAVSDSGYAKLTGLVKNTCAVSAGVRLKWTALNSDGTVAFSDDFFPAHTTNIAPGAEYPFETSNHAPPGRWTYTVEPVEVLHW